MPRTTPLLLALFEAVKSSTPLELSRALDEEEVDWAIRAGMGPLLFSKTRAAPEQIPASASQRLRAADCLARFESAELLEAATEILDSFREAPITLLKGISMCGEHYAAPHFRMMGDLDLLVDPSAVAALERALDAIGYRPGEGPPAVEYSAHHHVRPLFHPDTGICVEIHTGLMPPATGLADCGPFAPETFRAEQRPSHLVHRPVRRLSPELQLVYSATHWALGFETAESVRALLDTVLLLEHAGDELDWDRILAWLDDCRIAASLQVMLSYLEGRGLIDLAGAPLAGGASELATLGSIELAALHRAIDAYQVRGIDPGRVPGLNNVQIAWSTLLLSRSATRNLPRVPLNLLFPPKRPDRFRPGFQLRRLRSLLE